MKQTILILISALLCIGLVHAASRPGVRYGVRGGLNIARLGISADGSNVDTSSSLGYHGGVFLQFRPVPNLIVQPELLFSQKGSESTDADKATINYIVLPLLFKGALLIDSLRIQPHAGPEIGYAVSAKTPTDPNYGEQIKRLNLGLDLGVDLIYSDNYLMGIRYYHGLTELQKSSAKRPKLSNNCWSLSIGYLF